MQCIEAMGRNRFNQNMIIRGDNEGMNAKNEEQRADPVEIDPSRSSGLRVHLPFLGSPNGAILGDLVRKDFVQF